MKINLNSIERFTTTISLDKLLSIYFDPYYRIQFYLFSLLIIL